MLLSWDCGAGTGLLGFAKESMKAHLHNTFQCPIPVRRFSVTRVSRPRCETRIRSMGALMIPEIAGVDGGAVPCLIERQRVAAPDVRLETRQTCLVHLLVCRK